MRRHSLVARLGPADATAVEIHADDALRTELRFVDGRRRLGFGIGQMIEGLARHGILPSEVGVDLMILAATVTAADTRISRDTDSQDSWTREIELYVPVSDTAVWWAARERIERILAFLTGDRWRVFFRERHQEYRDLIAGQAGLVTAPHSCICLFSGGLDSFVGAIDLMAAGESPLLVSHYWDLSTTSQEACAAHIADAYGDKQSRHVRARIGFDKNDFSRPMGSEPTTRGRSFLFFAMAALAASGFEDGRKIYVPENGLISLNVPLDPLRVGAWSTRTTHPFYLARWAELLELIGIRAPLENPYRFATKGEMLANCRNPTALQSHIGATVSCSSISKARWKRMSPRHCGFCVPCLIRRSAMAGATLTDPTTYTIPDLESETLDSKSPAGEHIRSFQLLARRLVRRPELARILVYKAGPLADYAPEEVAEYAGVFRRGVEEVARFTADVVVRPT